MRVVEGKYMSIIIQKFDEKITFNSTAFLEIQFCKINDKKWGKKEFEVRNIKYGAQDSLYVYHFDIDEFLAEYGEIFVQGEYVNHKTGYIDPFGVTYFPKERIDDFIQRIFVSRPIDYEIMIEWLNEALKYNGINFLGL